MGLTERHRFENEDAPENYEWALEDAVHNSRTNKKHDNDIVRCKNCKYWDKGHTEECNNINSVCFHNGWCKPDWFCADGKRKEGL